MDSEERKCILYDWNEKVDSEIPPFVLLQARMYGDLFVCIFTSFV